MQPDWFNSELQADLNTLGRPVHRKQGETLLDSALEANHTYIILDGRVRVWTSYDPYSDEGSQAVLLDDLSGVDIVGEMQALDGQAPSAIVETITSVDFIEVSNDVFCDLMHKHRGLMDYILGNLCQKIREANERMRDVFTLPANCRVTREIIRLTKKSERCSHNNHNFIKEFPTHQILAARCGVTRETVSRTIACLAKKGILKRKGRSMYVSAIDELALAFEKQSERGDHSC